MRYRPEQHLRRQSDFRAIRERGGRYGCSAFTVGWLQREPAPAVEGQPAPVPVADSLRRIGVVASTAAVGNAVQRARAKRRLREVFRQHQELVPAGCDLLLTARRAILRTAYADLERAFADACRRISSPSSAPRA